VAVAKLQHALTGDTLGARESGPLPALELPPPVYSLAVHPKSRGDEDKIGTGLARLAEEDPTLHIERSEITHQLVISGMGDVHLDVILEKLKRKYGVEAVAETPKVAHKETLAGTARAEGRHVKQSGGHGQFAVCTIEVSPTAHGEGFKWEDKIFGGSIPQNFRPSIQKGIIDTMAKGVVAGHEMVDIKVTLLDGKYHTVDSSDMAFQIAGSIALRKAAAEAHPVILEPVMNVEVKVPERYLGDIMSEVNTKRGKISGTEPGDGWQDGVGDGAGVGDAEVRPRPPIDHPGPGHLHHEVRPLRGDAAAARQAPDRFLPERARRRARVARPRFPCF